MKRWEEYVLLGETLREVGVLVGVFVPIDALFQASEPPSYLLETGLAVGLCFATGGIILEAEGRRRLK